MEQKFYIEIRGEDYFSPLADATYCVEVGQIIPGRGKTCEPEHGLCSASSGVDTVDEVVAFARRILEQYREHPHKRNDGWPAPTAENTEFRDETGEFSMAQFFDRGTLAAYMEVEV